MSIAIVTKGRLYPKSVKEQFVDIHANIEDLINMDVDLTKCEELSVDMDGEEISADVEVSEDISAEYSDAEILSSTECE